MLLETAGTAFAQI